jgi:hypothetical protein
MHDIFCGLNCDRDKLNALRVGVADAGEPNEIVFLAGRTRMLFLKTILVRWARLPRRDLESPFFATRIQLLAPPVQPFGPAAGLQKAGP